MDFNISSIIFSISKTTEIKPIEPDKPQEFQVEAQVAKNQNSQPKETIILPKINSSLTHMNNMQMNMFLKEMLSLPKEWSALLSEFMNLKGADIKEIEQALSNLNTNSKILALLQANPKVDLAALAKLISENSANLTDKMVKLMTGAIFDKTLISQMKEISLIGSSIATVFNINQSDFIRSVIQMYLPWLPFVPPEQRENTERLTEAFSDEEQHSSAQTSFFITTSNLGFFKIEIAEEKNIEIFVTRIADKIDETDEILKKTIRDVAIKYFREIDFNYYSKEQSIENVKKEKELHILNSSNSAVSLMLLQMLSRKIFESDDKKDLDNKRAAKLEKTTPNE